ncbi:hypothetical protein [Candidatus Thalassolituus haligoni]|uniref:hypothetical protein n=1 Tax=Candidatus Thalassolituus haligoni TaxID=3100113 RepID=UPI0035196D3C
MKTWNLQHRVLLMGLLPGLIVSLVLGSYFISQRFRDLNDLLDQRALAMAKQLAPVCEWPRYHWQRGHSAEHRQQHVGRTGRSLSQYLQSGYGTDGPCRATHDQ